MLLVQLERHGKLALISVAVLCFLFSVDVLPPCEGPFVGANKPLPGSANISVLALREECDVLAQIWSLKNIQYIDDYDCKRVQIACGVSLCHEAVVDAVVLWVNGSDTAWRGEYDSALRYAKAMVDSSKLTASAIVDNRFRDFGQLKYSLRSMEMYAPWIRRIYIVSDNQWPNYLKPANESLRLRYVTQSELFNNYFEAKEPAMRDMGRLHNYNSKTLEFLIPFIPTLGNEYIYFNDDMAVMNKVPISKIYDVQSKKGIMETWKGYIPNFATTFGLNTALQWAQNIIPDVECIRPQFENGTVDDHHCLQPFHGPKLKYKELFTNAWDVLNDDMKTLLYHPFRDQYFDPNPWVFLSLIGVPSHYTVAQDTDSLFFATLTKKNYQKSLQRLNEDTTTSWLCMNDDFMDGDVTEEVEMNIQTSYEKKYPSKASFEV